MIDVTLSKSGDPYEFDVRVSDGSTESHHHVTMKESTFRSLGGGEANPERVIEAAFEFLLEREPKESILSRFDVTVISEYFPSFDKEIARYL